MAIFAKHCATIVGQSGVAEGVVAMSDFAKLSSSPVDGCVRLSMIFRLMAALAWHFVTSGHQKVRLARTHSSWEFPAFEKNGSREYKDKIVGN